MRASIVEILSLNFVTHVKNRTFITAMARSSKLFLRCLAQLTQAHSLTTLQEKSNTRIDCWNAGFEICHTRKKKKDFCHCYGLLSEAVFTLFRPSAFTYDTKKKVMRASIVQMLTHVKNRTFAIARFCHCYGALKEAVFTLFRLSIIYDT